MKKAKIIIALLVVLAVCFGLAACKETPEYTLNKTTVTLKEGETQQLTVSSSLDNEFTVEYKTSDAAVASVSTSGLVTAVKAGTAAITATVDGTELTCNVTVTEATKPVVYEYALSETEITVVEGGYKDLSVNVTPAKDITVTYTSDNLAIATVDANGRVNAVAVGETTIKAAVDGKELTCKVTVEKMPPTYTLKAVGTPLTEGNKTLIEKGATLKFEVTSSEVDDEFTVQWSTSDEAIATVAQDGTVTAVANGDVTVKAKIGNVEKTVAVQVFTYQYTYEQALTLAYGTTDAKLAVTVDHGKTPDIKYVLANEDVVAIDEQGNIEIKGVGTATVTVKDGEKEVGTCVITVNAVFIAPKTLQMHVGEEKEWTITANPVETEINATYEVVEGDTVVSIDNDGKVNALANGTAKVKATIGDLELTCDILVNGVNAAVTQKDLDVSSVENLSGSDIAYWENYINHDEINHKAIATDEEDVIEKVFEGTVGFLGDYAKLVWTDGGNCAKPTMPNGCSEGATIRVSAPGQEGVNVTLTIKVVKGKTQIKVYTGVFKGTCTATLFNGATAIASYKMENFDLMTRELLTFDVDVVENGEITIELALTNAQADNSFITLAAVSVSGSTYQLEESSKRLAPEGTATIVLNKDGEALTEGVTYEIIEGSDVVSISNNVVTGIKLGTAKIAVTADGRTRIYTVEVGYAYSLDFDKVQLHKDQTHQINVVSEPDGATIVAQYESTNQAIATVSDSGLVTAVANGDVIIKVRVDEKEYELTVKVSDVVVTSAMTKLDENNRDNPIDITDGAEYWEQYISYGEVNHKQYVNDEEDIIDKTCSKVDNYDYFLKDYASFLSWHDGANGSTCACGQCNKESQNGGDGGWTDKGTKSMRIGQVNAVTSLQFKLFAGESVIKIYTGGYNLVGRVQLKLDGQVIAEETFDQKSQHISRLVTFTVDTLEACEVTAELVMLDNYGDNNNSCISLAAASVSGSVYQLAKASERVAPNGQAQIVLNKDGVAMNSSDVTYEVVTKEGETALATVDENGLVTAGATKGTATIKVTADGRVRYYTVEIGYDYVLESNNAVTLKPNETYQINVVSNPTGSTAEITYTSGDEDVATVSSTGLITAVANGSTTITATVEGKELTVNVTVSGIAVSVKVEDNSGAFVNLNSSEVLYWEHYLYNEKASMTLGDGQRDLIEGEVDGKSGDAGYAVHMYFTNAQGSKHDSYQDGAYHKFSWGDHFLFNITVPVGTYEIRVYTGAWENTENKISLWDGESQLESYTLPITSGGITRLITFTVTLTEEKVLTLKLDALQGNNCRLAAIAIADPSVQKDHLSATIEEVTGGEINLTEKGNLDWVAFSNSNVEKADADLISSLTLPEGGGNGQGDDYKANLTWTDADGDASGSTHNFKWHDYLLDVTVNVDATTKKVTLYVSGWKATYGVFVTDKDGNTIYNGIVCTGDGSNSKAVAVTFDIDVAEANEYTFSVRKIDKEGNLGVAAVTVAGEVETPEVTD